MLRRSHQLSCCDEYSGILTARSELSAHVRAPRLWASNRLAMCCAALSPSRYFAHRLPVRRGEVTIQLVVLANASHLAYDAYDTPTGVASFEPGPDPPWSPSHGQGGRRVPSESGIFTALFPSSAPDRRCASLS